MFHPLADASDLERAVAQSNASPVVLFKHSTACGISHTVRRRLEALTEPTDPPVYELVVQQHRLLAHAIAERFGIRHASPQALVVYQGTVIWDASHSRVHTEAIREAVALTTDD